MLIYIAIGPVTESSQLIIINMITLDNTLRTETFELNGHSIQIRIEPPEFRKAFKEVNDFISQKNYCEALETIDRLPYEWQNDPEFIRATSLIYFLNDSEGNPQLKSCC